jgi:cell division septal protein FtsQ
VGVVATAAGAFAVAWPGFEPKRVDVIGNEIVPRSEILERAAISPHVNMWLQDTRAMKARIAAIPYIAAVGVYRAPPSTIVISVSERRPFALVRSGERYALVDRDLRVLAPAPENPSLVQFVLKPGMVLAPGTFLRDPNAAIMRDDYEAMIAAHVVPRTLLFDRFGGLVATVRGGVKILLGDSTDLSKKLALVDPIIAQLVRKQSHVAAVDLRAPATPVLVYGKL